MPPSTHAAPTHVMPMIAVRFSPRVTLTPPLLRLASRTTTAPGTGSRFAAEPMIVTWRISSRGGWCSARCAISRNSNALSTVIERHAHEAGEEDELPADRFVDRRQVTDRDRREHDEERDGEDQQPRAPRLVARRAGRGRGSGRAAAAVGSTSSSSGGVVCRRAGSSGARHRGPSCKATARSGMRIGPNERVESNRRARARRLARRVVLGTGAAVARRGVVPSVAVDLPSVSSRDATLHDDAAYVRDALDALDRRRRARRSLLRRRRSSPRPACTRRSRISCTSPPSCSTWGSRAQENELTAARAERRSTPAIRVGDGVLTIDPRARGRRALPRLRRRRSRRRAVDRLRPQSLAALAGQGRRRRVAREAGDLRRVHR